MATMSSAAQAAPSRAEPEPLSRKRAISVWTLVVVASILMLFASLTVWVKRQALDTDAWTNASGQMLADDQIREQLSIYLVDTLFSSADATARIQQSLPANRAGLAPVIAGALQNVAVQAADRILETPQAQALWEDANPARAREPARRPQRRRRPALRDRKRRGRARPEPPGPAAERAVRVPGVTDAGKITILHSGQLKNAQRALKVIKVASVFLLVLVLFLYGLAIYLARGHRARLLRATAASFLLVGVLVLVIAAVTGGVVVDSLIKTDAIRPAGNQRGESEPSSFAAWRTRSSSTAWSGSSARGSRADAVGGGDPATPGARFRGPAWIVYGAVALCSSSACLGADTSDARVVGILLLGALLFFGVAMLHRETVARVPAQNSAGLLALFLERWSAPRERDRLEARMHAERAQDVADVVPHRLRA
jgi:hypothetical protein